MIRTTEQRGALPQIGFSFGRGAVRDPIVLKNSVAASDGRNAGNNVAVKYISSNDYE